MRRHTTLLSALALTAGGLTLGASPAFAVTATITDLDASVAGHVTGTVTSDAEMLSILVTNTEGSAADDPMTIDVPETSVGDSWSFDLSTWGLTTGQILVRACDATWSNCFDAATSDTFTATDVDPALTWGAEDGATVTTTAYDVSATDSGGGYLFTGASNVSSSSKLLKKNGTPTTLDLETDGPQTVSVWRCADTDLYVCRTIGERTVTVDQPIQVTTSLGDPWPGTIDVDAHPSLPLTVQVSPGAERELPIAVTTRYVDGNGVEHGIDVVRQFQPRSDGTYVITGDLSDLPTGSWTLRVKVAWGDADDPTKQTTQDLALDIVNGAPTIAGLTQSATSVYPIEDGYKDTARFRLRPQDWSDFDVARLRISSADDTVVRTLEPTTISATDGYLFTWDGTDGSAMPVAAGTYTVTGVLTDSAGNASEQTTTVNVVRKHIESRTFTKTVTPGASFAAQYLGRCSVIRKPSLRGWSGSVGLYSNAKCSGTVEGSLAETQHGMYVPKALRYGTLKLSAYGGGATKRPSSTASFVWYGATEHWAYTTTLSATLGKHSARSVEGSWAIHDQGTDKPWIYWSNYVGKGNRYDVKSYTVTLSYDVLVND